MLTDAFLVEWSALLYCAFPLADTLEIRYTYLQGKHWLLPVAWLHRVIMKKHSTAEYMRETKAILFADEEGLKKNQTLYNRIGL